MTMMRAAFERIALPNFFKPVNEVNAHEHWQTWQEAWEAATAVERERFARILEAYRVPVGNRAAGEMAADWTMDALREIRNAIRGA